MPSGGILLDGTGKRSLDSTGKQILDDACAFCCCVPRSFKAVIAGVTLCSCPIANLQVPCIPPPVAGLCNNMPPFFVNPSTFCDGNKGDQLCAYNYTGDINGTYWLVNEGILPGGGCNYVLNINPPPIAITANTWDGTKFVCGNAPLIPQVLAYAIGLTIDPGGGSASFSINGQFADSTYAYLWDLSFFAATIVGAVCGVLCPISLVANSTTQCMWGTNLIIPAFGGTVTLTPQP